MLEQALNFLKILDPSLEDDVSNRKLKFKGERFEIFLAKPWDLPLYVEERVADLGIIGRDIIIEQERKVVSLIKLPFGYCKMVLAGFPEDKNLEEVKIASKYVNITRRYLNNRWNRIKIIKLNGSVELGPILNISDYIVDLVETGRTLKENGLVVKEILFESSACLIANISSYVWKRKEISDILKEVENIYENN